VVVLVLGSHVGGCGGGVGDCEERYLFFERGAVMFRCDSLTGACIAGRAGEEGVFAVLPPAGESMEDWAEGEGLRLVAGREGEGVAVRDGAGRR
jgi:hypothetical protein